MVSCISKGRFANFSFVNMAAYIYSLRNGLEFHIQHGSLAPHLWPLYFQDLKNEDWNNYLESVEINDGKHTFTELEFNEEWRDKNIFIGTKDINTGYFQSYKYFYGAESAIRLKFGLGVDTNPHTCSIHVRGGDYLKLPLKHPVITKEYLVQSIRQVIGRTGCKWFFIYTDDVEFCVPLINEVIKEIGQGFNFSLVLGGDELSDFKGMMSCANNITANSSYSVLAAILSPNPDRVVICPHEDNYFGIENKHLSVEYLYPPSFIQIKY